MEPNFKNLSDKFAFLDKLHHLNKLSLFVVISLFAAIPVTVFGIVTLRQIDPQAATGQPSSLLPAYSSNTINPTFSWDCFCYTTLYRIHVREGDGTFYAGDWYKDVPKGSSNITTTSFTGFSNNNYKTPIPGSMEVGKTYYWTVSCVTGGCNTSATQAFTVVDNVAPSVPTRLRIERDRNGTSKNVRVDWTQGIDNYQIGFDEIYWESVLGKSAINKTYATISFQGGVGNSFIIDSLPSSNITITVHVRSVDTTGNKSPWVTATAVLPDVDIDKDGFDAYLEGHMGTNPNLACGVNAWPPDFNNDKIVNPGDQSLLSAQLGKHNILFDRYDLNGDGIIDQYDQAIESSYVNKRCT